jgi:transposase
MQVIRIGLDVGKRFLQVHGVDGRGVVVAQRKLRRAEVEGYFAALAPCLIGMEACATAHHWSRVLMAQGHTVRLVPPAYVKAYLKRGKSDAADAAAICEAIDRPSMHFVPVKSAGQQAALVAHRVRALLMTQRTMTSNALRAHLAEFGLVAAAGIGRVEDLIALVVAGTDPRLPAEARGVLLALVAQYRSIAAQIECAERSIMAQHKASLASRRLAQVPGIGPITATALVAAIGDARAFRSGRHFAAWLGLTPRQNGTGGKMQLGRISKGGDRYLRTLLVLGATAVLRSAKRGDPRLAWLRALLERKPARLATIAQANKNARIVWAMLTRGEAYRPAAQHG